MSILAFVLCSFISCFWLSLSSAYEVHEEDFKTGDFDAIFASQDEGIALFQVRQQRIISAEPAAASDTPSSLADFYKNQGGNGWIRPKSPPVERTMADMYYDAFQDNGDAKFVIHAASPSASRISFWVCGFMMSAFASLTLMGFLGVMQPPKTNWTAPPSRLVGRCKRIEKVPLGTVCAVCLEGVDSASREAGNDECMPCEDAEVSTRQCTITSNEKQPEDIDGMQEKDTEKQACMPCEASEVSTRECTITGNEKQPEDIDGMQEKDTKKQAEMEAWCQTPCGHLFHKDCIDRWLVAPSSMQKRCPVCNWS